MQSREQNLAGGEVGRVRLVPADTDDSLQGPGLFPRFEASEQSLARDAHRLPYLNPDCVDMYNLMHGMLADTDHPPAPYIVENNRAVRRDGKLLLFNVSHQASHTMLAYSRFLRMQVELGEPSVSSESLSDYMRATGSPTDKHDAYKCLSRLSKRQYVDALPDKRGHFSLPKRIRFMDARREKVTPEDRSPSELDELSSRDDGFVSSELGGRSFIECIKLGSHTPVVPLDDWKIRSSQIIRVARMEQMYRLTSMARNTQPNSIEIVSRDAAIVNGYRFTGRVGCSLYATLVANYGSSSATIEDCVKPLSIYGVRASRKQVLAEVRELETARVINVNNETGELMLRPTLLRDPRPQTKSIQATPIRLVTPSRPDLKTVV